jgi:hypothetical protein
VIDGEDRARPRGNPGAGSAPEAVAAPGRAGAGTAGRSWAAAAWTLALLALYSGAAVVTTWPLVRRLGTAMPGRVGDQSFYMWAVDTFWTQLRAGESPFVTDRVLYPLGASMMHATTGPLIALLGYPFLDRLPLYLALVALASLVVAAFGAFLLVRALTRDTAAAAIAGLAYGFSPVLLSILLSTHYLIAAGAALLPYGQLAVVRLARGGRPALPLAALSAVTWALFLTDFYVTVLHLLLVATAGCVLLPRLGRRALAPIAVALAANVLIAVAAVVWVLPPLDTGDLSGGGPGFWSRSVTNLADYLVPSTYNPFLGPRVAGWASDRPNGEVDVYFLGWGVLPLALAGAVLGRRIPGVAGLAAAGAAALVLACGTAIRFGSTELLTEHWTPFHWLVRLPSLNMLDTPRRFVIGVQLAVAALAGVGLARLAGRGRRRLVLAAGLLVAVVDYAQFGMELAVVPVPEIYRRLAAEPGDRTLLEIPSGVTESKSVFGYDFVDGLNNKQMYWQTVHRKRRVGVYFSRVPRVVYRWFDQQAVIGDIFTLATRNGTWRGRTLETLPDYPARTVGDFVRTFDLGWVILSPNPRQAIFAEAVERVLAGRIARTERDTEGWVLYVLAPPDAGG